MQVKRLNKTDYDTMKKSTLYCFHGEDQESADLFFNKTLKPEYCLGVYNKSKLLSSLAIFPLEAKIHSKWFKMGGISSVVTMPEHRYKGYVSMLIKGSLHEMKEAGQVLSMLAPFRYEFYRKYGWGTTFLKSQMEMDIKYFAEFGNMSCEYGELDEKNIEAINQIYIACISHYNGVVKRPHIEWQHKFDWIKKNKRTVYGAYNNKNQLVGYIEYEKKDEQFIIYEMAYTDFAARMELYRFAYIHNAECKKIIRYNIPQDDPILLQISSLHGGDVEFKTYGNMMTRIVDVEAFFSQMVFDTTINDSFTVRVMDSCAEWNNTVFEIAISDGKTTITKTEASSDVEIGISVLSQISLDFMSFGDALYLQKLKLNNADKTELLNSVFPKRATYMNEHF